MTEQNWWQAKLNPNSPRYLIWHEIFGRDEIPVRSPIPVKAGFDGETQLIYLLDWNAVEGEARSRLVRHVMEKYGVNVASATANLDHYEFYPIRKDDVIMRATPPHYL